jgi:hypothetical protein
VQKDRLNVYNHSYVVFDFEQGRQLIITHVTNNFRISVAVILIHPCSSVVKLLKENFELELHYI